MRRQHASRLFFCCQEKEEEMRNTIMVICVPVMFVLCVLGTIAGALAGSATWFWGAAKETFSDTKYQ